MHAEMATSAPYNFSCLHDCLDVMPGLINNSVTRQDVMPKILTVLRQTDFNVAVGIASHANQKLRDKLGNILTDIWSRNSGDAVTSTGQLTSQEDIQTYMRDMLKDHVESNKAVLLQCDNATLCTWIMRFVTSWEQQYRDAPYKYDISENILSVMRETVQYVDAHVKDTDFEWVLLEQIYDNYARDHGHGLPVLERDDAVVRFYFRHPAIARYMVLIAGKILQRRECNRNGTYCSTRQRNDVARELERAVSDFKFKVRSLERTEETSTSLLYLLDHKGMLQYITAAAVVADQTQGVAV